MGVKLQKILAIDAKSDENVKKKGGKKKASNGTGTWAGGVTDTEEGEGKGDANEKELVRTDGGDQVFSLQTSTSTPKVRMMLHRRLRCSSQD